MHTMPFSALLLLGMTVCATTARAQDPGPRRFPARYAPAPTIWPAALTIPRAVPASSRDLRWHGTVVGAVGLGVVGGLTGAAYCGNSEDGPGDCTGTTVLWSAIGATIGGVAGHFVGRLVPR